MLGHVVIEGAGKDLFHMGTNLGVDLLALLIQTLEFQLGLLGLVGRHGVPGGVMIQLPTQRNGQRAVVGNGFYLHGGSSKKMHTEVCIDYRLSDGSDRVEPRRRHSFFSCVSSPNHI